MQHGSQQLLSGFVVVKHQKSIAQTKIFLNSSANTLSWKSRLKPKAICTWEGSLPELLDHY